MESNNERDLDFLKTFDEIKFDMSKASLEDVESVLDNYNKSPIVVNGVAHHYTITPLQAASLNARYHELTGEDHPVFMEQAPKVIEGLMQDKDMLMQTGAYDSTYFDKLEQISEYVRQDTSTKKM